MSLLIKALDKAQAEKAQAKKNLKDTSKVENTKPAEALNEASQQVIKSQKPDSSAAVSVKPAVIQANELNRKAAAPQPLSLSPLEDANVKTDLPPASATLQNQISENTFKTENNAKPDLSAKAVAVSPRQSAANVFYAKQDVDQSQNIKLAIAATLAVFALFGIGLYYYLTLHKADNALPKFQASGLSKLPQKPVAENSATVVDGDSPQAGPAQVLTAAAHEKDITVRDSAVTSKSTKLFTQAKQPVMDGDAEQAKLLPQHDQVKAAIKKRQYDEAPAKEQLLAKSINIKRNNAIASESASIEITQNKTEPGVNPTLLRAYQAYNAGNDQEANQLYKQVLLRDGVNVDAMLGLGAIAARQNRAADANDWYRKVLEIEPKNSFAQAALLQVQANTQIKPPEAALADESAIKSMLAKTPNDANLYANLGNLYARQKQWPLAQQAYFDAYRLNASADNAFNLAISLDQLAKSKLALPYYKQALDLSASQANGIDSNALIARIHAIEAIEK